MSAAYSVHRFNDAKRLEELHRFVQDAFRDLPIDPPSSSLKETLADFAARFQSDAIFVASAADELIQHLLLAKETRSMSAGSRCIGTGGGVALPARCRGREIGGATARREAHDARRTHRAARQCRAVPPPRVRDRARSLPSGLHDTNVLRHGIGALDRATWRSSRYSGRSAAGAGRGTKLASDHRWGCMGLRKAAEIQRGNAMTFPRRQFLRLAGAAAPAGRFADRARASLSGAADPAHHRLSAGRLSRHHGAAGIAVARRAARPVRHCREPARRRHQHRDRSGLNAPPDG